MKKLKAAGLYEGGLVPLAGSLVNRYNQCLELIGSTPSTLKSFSIDGMGWSPEIAEEKNDNYYLNIGEANTNAIIISPDQYKKPVYMPSHSFDRNVMNAVFAAYKKEIRSITKDSAICLHLDQDIDAYYEPFDLLRYNKISVSFELLNNLADKQKEQEELIALFNEGNNFIDRDIHQKLAHSAKSYGDLRNRKLSLDPITLDVSSFYTRAFGGIFIFKDFIKDIMIFEDEVVFKKAISDTAHDVLLFHKNHDELMTTLISHLIVENDLKSALSTDRYKRIKQHLFFEEIENVSHSFKEILDSHFLFKKYLNLLDVELYYQKRITNKQLKIEDFVDEIYFKVLLTPHSSLQKEHEDLIWKLLVKIVPKDPVHAFWYDKELFYNMYNTWNPTYQDWVIEQILKNNKEQDS